MSKMCNECVVCNECVELKRQNAICVRRVEIDFADDEENDELYDYLDKILQEQELKDMERKRINQSKVEHKNQIK